MFGEAGVLCLEKLEYCVWRSWNTVFGEAGVLCLDKLEYCIWFINITPKGINCHHHYYQSLGEREREEGKFADDWPGQ